jgi:Holliday junction resolvase-like predicted endonuclease
MKDTDRRIKEVSQQLGGMGNSNGAYAEDYFANVLAEKLEFAGQQYDAMDRNLQRNNEKLKGEFDIVMYNGNSVAIIEVKYKVQTKDLEEMVTKKVSAFRTLFRFTRTTRCTWELEVCPSMIMFTQKQKNLASAY